MKINKIFHWLYGFLMFMPVFAVGVTCGYVVFNKNANESYSGNYTFERNVSIAETKQINETNSTVVYTTGYNLKYTDYYFDNNNYILDFKLFNNVTLSRFGFNFKSINFSNEYFNSQENEKSIIIGTDATGTVQPLKIWYYANDLSFLKTVSVQNPDWYRIYGTPTRSLTLSREDASNLTANFVNDDRTLYFTGNNYNFVNNNISKNIITSIFINDTTLSNVFYSSIDKVTSSPLFNWAYNSFLGYPITFITGLFGIVTNSVVNMLLSYWLAISIIWLVFDLIMYVPLLVHSWIDKAGIN